MMPNLTRAGGPIAERILQETYPIWNEGLTFENYRRWNDLQMRTAWGKDHLWRMALVDGDEILASAKHYDLKCASDGATLRVLGIGAVFTPEAKRGRGYARQLIARMEEEAEREGYQAALLFSEIGAPIYERMGFTAIPRDTVTLDIKFPRQGPPATMVRAGEDADLKYLAEFHKDAGFGPIRTPDLIKFNVVKQRVRAASSPIGSRVVEFFVSEEGHRPVSYVLLSRGPSGNLGDGPDVMWLEAYADRDPSGARVGAMLQVLRARTATEQWPALQAWLPDGWLPPQLGIVARAPAGEILMVKPLGNNVLPSFRASDLIWAHADCF
jgi:GNAT superfamily N-acetyltransferase